MGLLADDPWGVAMWACAVLAGIAVVWALLALALRRPARAATRLLGLGTFGYLATAATSVVLRVSAAASTPAPPEPEPEVRISSVDPQQSDGKAADAKAPVRPAIDPSISGPPQRTGREALRFASDVTKDGRCTDTRAVAGAVRDLAAAAATEPRAKVDKAIDRLEDCRKKIVWVAAASVRRKRIDARETWVESLKTRMKDEGTPVFVSLRGAAHDRIRLGGGAETIAKLRGQWDGTLRKEFEDLGFTEVTFANMKDTERFEFDVPSDHQLAARELASWKLDKPITVIDESARTADPREPR